MVLLWQNRRFLPSQKYFISRRFIKNISPKRFQTSPLCSHYHYLFPVFLFTALMFLLASYQLYMICKCLESGLMELKCLIISKLMVTFTDKKNIEAIWKFEAIWNKVFKNDTGIKGAATDMRYFLRSKISMSLVHKKGFSLI